MEKWYVAKAKPQKENCLVDFLSHQGVEVFFPSIIQCGRTGPRLQALFPTYLFCHLDAESSIWPTVRWAPGMLYFLNQDGKPSTVPESVIDYLRQRVDQLIDQASSSHLKKGDRVLLLNGPFSGLEGVFQRHVPSRDRCRILLDQLAQLGTIEVPGLDLKGISQDSEAPLVGAGAGR